MAGWLALSVILILATYYGRALRWAIFPQTVEG